MQSLQILSPKSADLTGDVIGLFDSTGTRVVQYTYDPWGKLLSITSTAATTIGALNPIRYRGYYYDTETGAKESKSGRVN